jgi:hypothetical protein
MVSAVPAGDVMLRDDVFGMRQPRATSTRWLWTQIGAQGRRVSQSACMEQ